MAVSYPDTKLWLLWHPRRFLVVVLQCRAEWTKSGRLFCILIQNLINNVGFGNAHYTVIRLKVVPPEGDEKLYPLGLTIDLTRCLIAITCYGCSQGGDGNGDTSSHDVLSTTRDPPPQEGQPNPPSDSHRDGLEGGLRPQTVAHRPGWRRTGATTLAGTTWEQAGYLKW